MNCTRWCAIIVAWGMVVCFDVHSQSNQEIYQAIQRYNSGTIDGEIFSATVLETAYRSEDPKSIADTLKNSQVTVTDRKLWGETIIELAEYLGLLGEYREAVSMYEYLTRHPQSQEISTTEIWGRIALLQFVNNDVQDSLASVHKALTTATNQDEIVKALLLDARFRGLSSDPQGALAVINELIIHNPSSVHMRLLLYTKFEIQQTIGDDVGAEATQAQLSQRYPNSIEHGIVNTQERNASIVASPLPVAIDYIFSLYNEHSSDHTHTHRLPATNTSATDATVPLPITNTSATQSSNNSVAATNNRVRAAQSTIDPTNVAATTQQVVVQLGAFVSKLNAEILQNKSASIGVPAHIVLVDNVYKVQVTTPLTKVAEVQSRLRQADIEAYIVR